MKVTLNEFKTAFALFQSEFISGMKTGLNLRIDEPSSVAADLIVGTVGALTHYGAPVIVIDMDTCGGEFELPINFGVLSSIGATPVNVKFGLDDVEKFFGKTLPAVSNGKK